MTEDLQTGLLTVLLPSHRHDKFLYQAIVDSLNALPSNSEVLLIDTSEYGTLAEYQGFDGNLRYLNVGTISYIQALSIGIQQSKSKYIALMNSDDRIVNSRFIHQLEIIQRSNSDISLTNIVKMNKSCRRSLPSLLGDVSDLDFNLKFLLLGSYYANASWLFKKDWAIRNRLFDPTLDVFDWQTALRVFPKAKVSYISKCLYMYRMHKGQITRITTNRDSSFLNYWRSLNGECRLPNLSDNSIYALSQPQLSKNLTIQNIDEINNWIAAFLNYKNENDISKIPRELILRRLAILNILNKKLIFRKIPIWTYLHLLIERLYLGSYIRN